MNNPTAEGPARVVELGPGWAQVEILGTRLMLDGTDENIAGEINKALAPLTDENARFRKALQAIQLGPGPFQVDTLTDACDVIDDLKKIAREALGK